MFFCYSSSHWEDFSNKYTLHVEGAFVKQESESVSTRLKICQDKDIFPVRKCHQNMGFFSFVLVQCLIQRSLSYTQIFISQFSSKCSQLAFNTNLQLNIYIYICIQQYYMFSVINFKKVGIILQQLIVVHKQLSRLPGNNYLFHSLADSYNYFVYRH